MRPEEITKRTMEERWVGGPERVRMIIGWWQHREEEFNEML